MTRGKDGRGRYGREMHSRRSSADSYVPSSPVAVPHLSISPWAPDEQASTSENKWVTPTRRMADDAWVIEHSRRASELDELSSKMSQSSRRPSFSSSQRTSPNSSYERITEIDEIDELEEFESVVDSLDFGGRSRVRGHRRRDERAADAELSKSHFTRHSGHGSDRKSHQTVPVIENSGRRQRMVTGAKSEYNAHDGLQLVRRPRRSATMSEAYAVAPAVRAPPAVPAPPPPFMFESPISGSPVIGNVWETQYQVVSSCPPAQQNAYYQRTFVPPVH